MGVSSQLEDQRAIVFELTTLQFHHGNKKACDLVFVLFRKKKKK